MCPHVAFRFLPLCDFPFLPLTCPCPAPPHLYLIHLVSVCVCTVFNKARPLPATAFYNSAVPGAGNSRTRGATVNHRTLGGLCRCFLWAHTVFIQSQVQLCEQPASSGSLVRGSVLKSVVKLQCLFCVFLFPVALNCVCVFCFFSSFHRLQPQTVNLGYWLVPEWRGNPLGNVNC